MSSAIEPTAELLELELTPQRLRVWGIRSGLTVLALLGSGLGHRCSALGERGPAGSEKALAL